MIGFVSFVQSAVSPASSEGNAAVQPARGHSGESGSHDPSRGRLAADPCSIACDREPDTLPRARGPYGVAWTSMADRLVASSEDDAVAGPKAESAMVTESHRRAGRQAMLAAALADALGGRPVEAYTVERPPGRAPEVIQANPAVRIGTILDIVA